MKESCACACLRVCLCQCVCFQFDGREKSIIKISCVFSPFRIIKCGIAVTVLVLMLMPLAFNINSQWQLYIASLVSVSECSCSFWRAMHQNTCICHQINSLFHIVSILTIKAFTRKSFAFDATRLCNHYSNINICMCCAVLHCSVPHATLISRSPFLSISLLLWFSFIFSN